MRHVRNFTVFLVILGYLLLGLALLILSQPVDYHLGKAQLPAENIR